MHNLHGIPAVVGTLVAGLAALGQDKDYLLRETGGKQLAAQVCGCANRIETSVGQPLDSQVRLLMTHQDTSSNVTHAAR